MLETGIPQDFMMLKPDQIADCTGYGLQDLMLLFIFNSAFIKMVASPPWRSAGSGWRRGKRMRPIFFHYLRLGCSGWAIQMGRQAEEKSEKKIGVGGKLMDWKLKRGQKVHGL